MVSPPEKGTRNCYWLAGRVWGVGDRGGATLRRRGVPSPCPLALACRHAPLLAPSVVLLWRVYDDFPRRDGL